MLIKINLIDEQLSIETIEIDHMVNDSKSPSVMMTKSGNVLSVVIDDCRGALMTEGNSNTGDNDSLLNSSRRLFYTNENNRSHQHPPRQGCRNSLPGISLTSLTRVFTPRSSWNGSNAALIHLHQGNSRRLEGLPSYMARRYHMATANSREQVCRILVKIFTDFCGKKNNLQVFDSLSILLSECSIQIRTP